MPTMIAFDWTFITALRDSTAVHYGSVILPALPSS